MAPAPGLRAEANRSQAGRPRSRAMSLLSWIGGRTRASRAALPTARLSLELLEGRALPSGGAQMVMNIAPDKIGQIASSAPEELVRMGDVVFFSASTPGNGRELWRSDGTAAGTEMVIDLRPGASSSAPTHLTVFAGFSEENRRLLFTANDGSGPALWRTDGTAAGTTKLVSLLGGEANFTEAGSTVFFTGQNTLIQVSIQDGHIIDVVHTFGPVGNLLVAGGRLYFTANMGKGVELYRTTNGAPLLVADINPGVGGSNPHSLTAANRVVYFAATDPQHGTELWGTRATNAQTNTLKLIEDIRPGPGSSNPANLTMAFGTLYFSATNGSNGVELWKKAPRM